MRIDDGSLAGHLVFVATAARLPGTGSGGVRSAMARAAALLAEGHVEGAAPPRHEASTSAARSLRAPTRRRTRRYAERRSARSAP